MFSEEYNAESGQYFAGQMALLDDRRKELEKKEAGAPDADKNWYRFSRILLEQKIDEIHTVLAQCTEDEARAMKFLYGAMPLSDLLDYPASLYLEYARHGVFLWKEGPFAGKVPEKLFANYVLHHRAHNEDIADTRSFFYREIKDRISGKNMYDAAVEINYWCAEKATYRTTFMRTQNPMTMYNTAIGRCGEEAPFVVTALRSAGIPAREVSAPWWAHCDDNHAWAEAWCDGSWHYLGGCEPERSLDKGWFSGPASRAMLINSVWFGRDEPEEAVVGRPDMSARLNHLDLYSETVRLTVKVEDEEGNPVPGARVEFHVLNYAGFKRIAVLYTGAREDGESCGRAELDTGFGDLLVCAWAEGCYGESQVCLEEMREAAGEGKAGTECTIVLKEEPGQLDRWRDLDFHAPREAIRSEVTTEEEFREDKDRLEYAAQCRKDRTADFYRKEEAERAIAGFPEEHRAQLEEILRLARGNMAEIVRFLEWDFGGEVTQLEACYGQDWKLKALKTLRENDYWDIKAQALAECSICASPYAGTIPEEIFFSDLLNPCAMYEFPRACRAKLLAALDEEQKEQIQRNPEILPGKLEELVVFLPEQEYANLIVSPLGCLTGGMGSELSRTVLCIQIYRALGIPARVRPMDRRLEYYREGAFVPLGAGEAQAAEGKLILRAGDSLGLEDWKHYSVSRYENGRFTPLFLRSRKKEEHRSEQPADAKPAGEEHKAEAPAGKVPGKEALEEKTAEGGAQAGKTSAGEMVGKGALEEKTSEVEGQAGKMSAGEMPEDENTQEFGLRKGLYRIVTTNRLPNGNQFVKLYDFRLEENETKEITLEMRDIPVEALLSNMPVEDMALKTAEGEKVPLSALSRNGKTLMLWLELTREPTEHILNELREKGEMFAGLKAPIYFVLRRGTDYARDETLMKTCGVLPQAELLFDDFGASYEKLSRQAGRNPGKLPLALILEGGEDCNAPHKAGMAGGADCNEPHKAGTAGGRDCQEGRFSCIYSDAGYNVGMADTLLRILSWVSGL